MNASKSTAPSSKGFAMFKRISLSNIFLTALLIGTPLQNLNPQQDSYSAAKSASTTTQTVKLKKQVLQNATPSDFEVRTATRKAFHTSQNIFYGSFFTLYVALIAFDPFFLAATALATGIYYGLDTQKASHASHVASHQQDIEIYFVTAIVNTDTSTAKTLEGSSPQEISEKAQTFVLNILEENPHASVLLQCAIKLLNKEKIITLSSFTVTPWGKSSHVRRFNTLQKHIFRHVGLKLEDQFIVTTANRFLKALVKASLTVLTVAVGLTLIMLPFGFGVLSVPTLLMSTPPAVQIFGASSFYISVASLGCMAYYGKDLYWF